MAHRSSLRRQAVFCAGIATLAVFLNGCSIGNLLPSQETGPPWGEWHEWRSSLIPQDVIMTEDQLWAAREAWLLDGAGQAIRDEDMPEIPDLVRWLEPGSVFGVQQAECFNNFGYNYTPRPGGGMGTDSAPPITSDAQLMEELRRDAIVGWTCDAMYTPIDSLFPQDQLFSDEVEYEYLVSFWMPCAQAQGIEFSQEPPSKATYLANIYAHNSGTWPWDPRMPYPGWTRESRRKYEHDEQFLFELFDTCPYHPPPQALYGDFEILWNSPPPSER